MQFKQILQSYGIALCVAMAAVNSVAAAPGAGDLPPKEIGKTITGETLTVNDYAGKVVVVSFWATWCKYCLKELPVLEKIQEVGGSDKVQVIAVNTEERAVFVKATRALKDFSMKLAYDPDKAIAHAYGVKGIPHLVIIGRDGHIVKVYRGYGEESLEGIAEDLNHALETPAEPAMK